MKSYRSLFALACSAMMAVAAVGCGDDTKDTDTSSSGTQGNKTVSDLDITPDTASMKVGETLQYKLKASYSDGSTDEDVSGDSDVSWTSSDAKVATVSSSGLVTAVDAGTVTITAKLGDETETESLVVTAP
jgi:uncharacterized protein YjdB